MKGYGLEQSKGGHYVIPINDFGDTTTKSISSDFVMQEHTEIVVMSDPRGSEQTGLDSNGGHIPCTTDMRSTPWMPAIATSSRTANLL